MATTPGVPLTGLTDTADLRNGTVLVPAGTVAGEPIAYDQANARVGNNFQVKTNQLATLQINTDRPLPDQRSFLQFQAQGVTQYFFTVGTGDTGRFSLFGTADRGGVGVTTQAEVLRFSPSNAVSFPGATAVFVPEPTAANHAARVTAIDATTGQLAIGGYEIGDTGWRNVTANADADVTAGSIFIRRVGDKVRFRMSNVSVATGGALNDLYDPPFGFGTSAYSSISFTYQYTIRANSSIRQAIIRNPSGDMISLVPAPDGDPFTSGDTFTATAEYETDEAWPASLPGTAVTFETQLPA